MGADGIRDKGGQLCREERRTGGKKGVEQDLLRRDEGGKGGGKANTSDVS